MLAKRGARIPVVLALAVLAPGVSGAEGQERPARAIEVNDKTLVAWVTLDTQAQRGGSALTLFDAREEAFDALVFGERAAGRWMAGSEFFRRTAGEAEQASWPAETADPKTLVQVAAVYRGRRVVLYRDGKPYAAYETGRPPTFRDDVLVLIGLRYLGRMGPIGPFAGSVEEARLYDVALGPEAVAALKPNVASDPKPLAWWTFEDGTARDVMGTFPPGRLHGGARIECGRLWLDGKDAFVSVRRPFRPRVQGLFFRPEDPETGAMWDTWLYRHDGTYYLYVLSGPGGGWHGVSLATSPDGVHWTEKGMILRKAPGVTWLGTGSTWRTPSGRAAKYQMNFSEWRGDRQAIFFAESNDLVRWTRLAGTFEFRQDPRWYEPAGRWDCIWTVPQPGGGLYGYWTATPKGRAGFGFGESADGVTWRALEPPRIDWTGDCEVGAVETIGGRYYLMLGGGKEGQHGMWTFTTDRPEGPWRRAGKNFRLLTSQGHSNTYFARFFPTPGGMLVNHHAIARKDGVFFGTLKRAVVDGAGTLRLAWWEGNDKLKHEPVAVRGAGGNGPVAWLGTTFDAGAGVVLEGDLRLPSGPDAPPRGLVIECADGQAAAVLVRHDGTAELGPVRPDGTGFKAENRIDREMTFGKPARLRLLLKGALTEFYLDDVLVQCYSLPERATGRVGLVAGREGEAVANLRAWK